MAYIKALPTLESQYSNPKLDAAIQAMFQRAKVPENYPILVRWEIIKFHQLDKTLGVSISNIYNSYSWGLSREDAYKISVWINKIQNHFIGKYLDKFNPDYQSTFRVGAFDDLPATLENVNEVYWQAFFDEVISRSKIGVSKVAHAMTWINENKLLVLGGLIVGASVYTGLALTVTRQAGKILTVNE